MNIEKYLQRINYTQKISITLETLNALQEAHLRTIPFENLDIHYNKKIKLDINAIFDKIIQNNRGGFCYELNGLFFQLLKDLGFEAKMISARVYKEGDSNDKNNYGEEYDHLAIIVTLQNKEFLVDVGFGKFSLHPLPIESNQIHKDPLGEFVFDKLNEEYFRINEVKNDKVIPQYIFTKQSRNLEEFEKMCLFHQTSSASHFTKKKIISLLKKDKRITLTDNQLKISQGNSSEEMNFDGSLTNFEKLLFENFSIKI